VSQACLPLTHAAISSWLKGAFYFSLETMPLPEAASSNIFIDTASSIGQLISCFLI